MGNALRQVRIQRMLDGALRSQSLYGLRRALSSARYHSSHEGGRASHSGRGRHRRRIYSEDGAQVSRRGGSLGGRPTDQLCPLKLDPEVATLAKEFVMMGGGLYAD